MLAGTEGQGTVAAAALADRVRGVKVKDSGGYSGEVRDMRTGAVVFSHRAGTAAIPASTTKLVTAAAALDLLGPEHRFTTVGGRRRAGAGSSSSAAATRTCWRRRPRPTRAGPRCSTLARSTARALKADGVRKVSLRLRRVPVLRPRLEPDLARHVRRRRLARLRRSG